MAYANGQVDGTNNFSHGDELQPVELATRFVNARSDDESLQRTDPND